LPLPETAALPQRSTSPPVSDCHGGIYQGADVAPDRTFSLRKSKGLTEPEVTQPHSTRAYTCVDTFGVMRLNHRWRQGLHIDVTQLWFQMQPDDALVVLIATCLDLVSCDCCQPTIQ
jgi:hypothetical protein